jgi:hypothetical protein
MRSWMVGCLLLAVTTASQATMFPENNLHLQDDIHSPDANMTEQQFSDIIDAVMIHFVPVAKRHGATLTVEKKWTDATVNAYAQQQGTNWKVSMFGGLARRPETNFEGFALVVCHEIGHHLGGFAFYSNAGANGWAASEGQSDYFATQVCGRMIWDAPIFGQIDMAKLSPFGKSKCDAQYTSASDRKICYRNVLGGQSLANLLSVLGNPNGALPKFETPDPKVVLRTATGHPAAQCRLDTYFQGALCNAKFDVTLIPGRNHPKGQLSIDAEMVSNEYSCNAAKGFTVGNRPNCWYKALVQ